MSDAGRIREMIGARTERTPAGVTVGTTEINRRTKEICDLFDMRSRRLRKKDASHLRAECMAVYVACSIMAKAAASSITPENLAALDRMIEMHVEAAVPLPANPEVAKAVAALDPETQAALAESPTP